MRYKILRWSNTDQRLFRGEDGHIYIADHSGSNPDQTDDGPLRVAPLTWIDGDDTYTRLTFQVPVHIMRASSSRWCSNVGCRFGVAAFLARLLKVPLFVTWADDGERYQMHLKPVPDEVDLTVTRMFDFSGGAK